MNADEKLKKLREFAKSVLENPKYKKELQYLLKELKITEAQAIQTYIDYDLDIYEVTNDVYTLLPLRIVLHMHNLLEGSWHQERQQTILDYLKDINPETAVDMGFGVPSKYITELVLKNKKPKLTLVDMDDTAFKFGEVLFDYYDKKWKKTITFKKLNMNDGEYVGDYDAYIFFDSIEHTKKPTEYLKKTVNSAPKHSRFVLSLPIAPPFPFHYIHWETEQEAVEWLNGCGLKINKSKKVYVNPEVDLFASEVELYNLIVECEKI